jgi:glycosyltransferase involved in cell wall biosynthesis
MLAHSLTGIPYSFTVHGSEEFDKPEYMGLGEKIRRSAFVAAITSYTRSQLYRWVEQAQWHKVQIVHCGLDRDFHDVPPVPVPAAPRLVNVGRLCEQKGQLLLVEAAAQLASDGVDFELVLAGDGEMRCDIEAAIARHGLQRQVRITGWISSAQVRAEILAARALVMSSFAEGLPVVIMEAMALRRPVLTTHITGIPELVLHGENGWLFPPGAVRELVLAMKACLSMAREDLDAMGHRARARVLARHDVDREAQRLAALFANGPARSTGTVIA